MTNLTTKQKKAKPTTTVSECCGAEVETRYSSFIDGNQYTCTKCRLVNCDVVERPTPTNPPTETVSDTQKLPPFYLTEFDKKFGIKENGEWGFTPEPYDVKYSLCMTADWVGQQIQDQVEAFIVDQKQHEVAVNRILENIPSLIAHIRRSL